MRFRNLLALGLLLCGNLAVAGLNEGLDALRKGDFATAVKELRPLADRGDAEAQYRIGLMYENGKGYPPDKAQGIAWFRKAAAQNHAAAQTELAVIYATGDGAPQDNKLAVEWFQKGAANGNATAQYNLGLLYAKGQGIKLDNAQAIAWWRKSAAQGMTVAQFKLGVAYENGEGVGKDPVLALANYGIAARGGNKEYAQYRDDIARQLTPEQRKNGLALADAWVVGQATPASTVAAVGTAAAAPVKTRCSATGSMGGEKFSASNCVASFYADSNSVAIWFNEDAITPAEAEAFQSSSFASGDKAGKPRTMAIIMFCPGGGKPAAAAGAVKSIDINTNHAKAPLAGIQRVAEAPRDFRVEKMSGEVKAGGTLSGKISGKLDQTSFTFDFDVNLPAREAAAGLGCGK